MAIDTAPIGKVELLYSKSKIYVHPSKNSNEHIAGYIYLIKEVDNEVLLGWIPEKLVETKQDLETFDKLDLETGSNSKNQKKKYFVSRPSAIGSFAFKIRISSLFSIQLRPPSPGLWYGSLVITSRSLLDKLPTLYFHDDECPGFKLLQQKMNKDFDPFGQGKDLYWGGIQVIEMLPKYCRLEKSKRESSVYLINATREELENFDLDSLTDRDTLKADKTGEFKFSRFLNDAKWSVLEALAKITTTTRHGVDNVLDESPAPIRKLLKNPEVVSINDDFDSARIYLAKWAMGVQEQAEQTRKQLILDQSSRNVLSKELGLDFDKLTQDEILNAHNRRKEISKAEWDSFFDHNGKLNITVHEVKDKIFHGGINDVVRPEAWLFELGVFPWESSARERNVLKEQLRTHYQQLKSKWKDDEDMQKDEYFIDQKFRIEKDIQRTDRNMDIYKTSSDEDGEDSADDSYDVSIIKNPHLLLLREILLTFNQYNDKLGYVQGMTDLLSPLYVVIQDEALVFWAFVKFMDRMERNFLSDQSGMRDQMNTLNELVQFMLPKLYIHLEKCDSNQLYFFFRMLLVWFKRELRWSDVLRLWEILWTDYYSSQFHLFFALSILQKHEKIIIAHLRQFDEVLRYINDLALTHNLTDLLIRSELLFLKFRRMVEIIDRGDVNRDPNGNTQESISPINENLRLLLSKEVVIQKETTRVTG